MTENLAIDRRKTSADPLSFDSLRSDAIKMLQQVSGETWTDYNLHDPGVTILEQLVYALTDLIYRSELSVADMLADGDGKIPAEELKLVDPAEILSCRAATALDYRKLILDAVPEVDNVWITPKPVKANDLECRGLYRISVKLAQDLSASQQEKARENIYQTYHEARNLCEDLEFADIELVEHRQCELSAVIEVESARDPAELLSEIYFASARRLASGVSITSYDQLSGQALPLDQLFDGPDTRHGFFLDEDTSEQVGACSDSTLFATINAIDGVDHVLQLQLKLPVPVNSADPGKSAASEGTDDSVTTLELLIPASIGEVKVSLSTNGRVLPFELDDVKARYEQIKIRYYASRSAGKNISLLYQPITGRSRPFNQYFSIQNQFPANYGVNQLGLPASATPGEQAMVRQLKGYLVIFEQLMANYLANISALKNLFSAKAEAGASYSVQALSPQQVADLSSVYPADPEKIFGRILAGFDDYHERKSRLLDYLLAVYGERFSQHSLRHFNFYCDKDEIEKKIVANKVAYLESIVKLGRDRGAAPEQNLPASERSRGGLAIRASMLLDFELRNDDSLVAAIDNIRLELRPHLTCISHGKAGNNYRLFNKHVLQTSGNEQLEQPSANPSAREFGVEELRARTADILPLQNGLLSDRLLTRGINPEHYQVGRPHLAAYYRLYLEVDKNLLLQLGNFADRDAATDAANCLRQLLLALNRDSEGLHIVEHLLLRPRVAVPRQGGLPQDGFYSFRISVIFPAWTRRCANADFRKLAEETILVNAPAHVAPDFFWLDYADMKKFEEHYNKWQKLHDAPDPDLTAIDQSSAVLVKFLSARNRRRQARA